MLIQSNGLDLDLGQKLRKVQPLLARSCRGVLSAEFGCHSFSSKRSWPGFEPTGPSPLSEGFSLQFFQ